LAKSIEHNIFPDKKLRDFILMIPYNTGPKTKISAIQIRYLPDFLTVIPLNITNIPTTKMAAGNNVSMQGLLSYSSITSH